MRSPLALLPLPLLAFSCLQDETYAPKIGDPFVVADPGKADGMLSSAEKARFETAIDSAITAAESTLGKLELEIAKLEKGHADKQKEADKLVQQIAAREAELQQQVNNNLILCLFFPNPAVCAVAVVIANDTTLRSYKDQLAAARAEQARIVAELGAYRIKRDALRARIVPVREGKLALIAMLQAPGALPSSPLLADAPAANADFGRATLGSRLEASLQAEIRLVVEIRNAAVELSQVLDQSLLTLRALEQSVDELVTAQRERFMDALIELISGDPGALADKWLEEAIAARTRTLLKGLDWPTSEFARYLLKSQGTNANPDKLLQDLLVKLAEGPAELPPVRVTANTSVEIHDFTTASSVLDMTDARTPARLEVFVDIQHTFVGDLVVSLAKDGQRFVLQQVSGGDQDDLVKTFVIADPRGIRLAGRWTLDVEDTAARDTGKLRGWQLTAFGGTR